MEPSSTGLPTSGRQPYRAQLQPTSALPNDDSSQASSNSSAIKITPATPFALGMQSGKGSTSAIDLARDTRSGIQFNNLHDLADALGDNRISLGDAKTQALSAWRQGLITAQEAKEILEQPEAGQSAVFFADDPDDKEGSYIMWLPAAALASVASKPDTGLGFNWHRHRRPRLGEEERARREEEERKRRAREEEKAKKAAEKKAKKAAEKEAKAKGRATDEPEVKPGNGGAVEELEVKAGRAGARGLAEGASNEERLASLARGARGGRGLEEMAGIGRTGGLLARGGEAATGLLKGTGEGMLLVGGAVAVVSFPFLSQVESPDKAALTSAKFGYMAVIPKEGRDDFAQGKIIEGVGETGIAYFHGAVELAKGAVHLTQAFVKDPDGTIKQGQAIANALGDAASVGYTLLSNDKTHDDFIKSVGYAMKGDTEKAAGRGLNIYRNTADNHALQNKAVNLITGFIQMNGSPKPFSPLAADNDNPALSRPAPGHGVTSKHLDAA